MIPERRAPIQGDLRRPDTCPYGTVAWSEFLEAYEKYKRSGGFQTPTRIVEQGGFSYKELMQFLGRTPETFKP